MHADHPPEQAQIRVARPADRAAVVAVIDAVAAERRYLRTDRYRPTPVWERLLAEGLSREPPGVLLVAERAGVVAGFARLAVEAEGGPGVIGIALLAAERGRGLGRRLLDELRGRARPLQIRSLRADILADNARSLRLFTRSGFVVTLSRPVALPYRAEPVEQLTLVSGAV